MLTRSQSAIIIDFDEASSAWHQNKIAKENGTYTYKCNAIIINGCVCIKPVIDIHLQKRI